MKLINKFSPCLKALLLAGGLIITCKLPVFAQKKAITHENFRISKLSIDGNASDWHLAKLYSNKQSKIAYAIGNNDSTLFLLLKSTDQADLGRVLRGGISIGINSHGEKKLKEQITFPIFQTRILSALAAKGMNKNQIQLSINEELAKLNEIRIGGFDRLLDGRIALKNEFGIEAAASLDENGFMVCEYALPMKLLQIDAAENDIFAVKIKVNGLNLNINIQNRSFNNMSGVFPQRLPATEGFEPTEFWLISRLAADSKSQ